MLIVNNVDKEIAWKVCQGKLLNTQFTWDRNNCSGIDTVIGVHHLIDKDEIKESMSKIKNRNTLGPLQLVSDMVKPATES